MRSPVSNQPYGTKPEALPPEEDGKSLGVWDAASIIVGIVVGTTIFVSPRIVFAHSSGVWWSILAWVVGGFLAFIGALCYAELATTYPKTGGDYVYLNRAYGSLMGFLFGWAQLTVVLPASIGVMAYAFAINATSLYDITRIIDIGFDSNFIYAFGAVTLVALLNLIGVVVGKLAQNILSVLKILALVAIIVVGFGWSEPNQEAWKTFETNGWPWGALAMIFTLYAYGGWNDAAFVASEVKNPERNIPKALFWGVGIITLLYVLVNVAYVFGLGWDEVRKHQWFPAFDPLPSLLVEKAAGGWGGKAMNILVMISALGAVNGLTFAGSRVYASLGNDHPIFIWLGRWKAGRGAPVLAIFFQAVITLAMVYVFGTAVGKAFVNTNVVDPLNSMQIVKDWNIELKADWDPKGAFEALVSTSAPVFWVFFLLAGLSVYVLRIRDANRPRPFRAPWFAPAIFSVMCGYMLYEAAKFASWNSLLFVIVVLIGIPLYLLDWVFGYRGQSAED